MTAGRTGSPTRTRALPIGIAVTGAAFPALFHRANALDVGPYGGIAPVNWVRIGTGWLVGLIAIGLIALLLWRLSGRSAAIMLLPATAAYWALAFFWRGNAALAGAWSLPGQVTTAVSAALVIVGTWLLMRLVATDDGPTALAVALAVPLLFTAWQARGFAELPSPESGQVSLSPVASRPDVWVIVLDALPNPDILSRLGWDAGPFVSELEELGYQVPTDSQSFSSGTYVTIATALALEAEPPAETVGPDDQGPWLASMQGNHPLARSLIESDYDFVMVENAFSFSECGPTVTDCRSYAWISEHELGVLVNSIAAPFLPDTHPWTEHTLRQLDELETLAKEEAERPRLVFAHLLMPHWPFDHAGDCQPATGAELSEWTRTPLGLRQTMDCLSGRLTDLARHIPAGDVVLMIGDHGSDLYDPFGRGFTAAQLQDRLSAFVAVSGCDLSEEYLTTNANAYRGVASCTTNGQFDAWPARPVLSCTTLSGEVRLVDASRALSDNRGLSCADE